jgi:hypothetical protein
MSSRAMELIWDVGQSVTIQQSLGLVGAGVNVAPPFIPLWSLGVKSLTDSLLSFSLPAFTFPFSPSLSANFDLLVIIVILSLVRTDGIYAYPFWIGYVNHILTSPGVLKPVPSAWLLGRRAFNRAPSNYAQARCAPLSRHASLAHGQLRRWYH